MLVNTLEFTILGECVPKGRPKFSTTGKFVKAYTPPKTEIFENFVKMCCIDAMNKDGIKMFEKGKPLYVTIKIHKQIPSSVSKKKQKLMLDGAITPTTKPDLDNCAKSILDALNGIAFADDSQVVSLKITKIYDEEAYTYVKITHLEEEI